MSRSAVDGLSSVSTDEPSAGTPVVSTVPSKASSGFEVPSSSSVVPAAGIIPGSPVLFYTFSFVAYL